MESSVPPTVSDIVANITELLDHIFEAADQQSLSRLCRVSDYFHSIAISHLWSGRRINLLDMRALLPEHVFETQYPWSNERELRRAPQDDSDWGRFRHYSVCVTSLIVATKDHPASLINYLADWSQLFFPRLRDLLIQAATSRYPAADCIRLAGPGLQRLEANGANLFGVYFGEDSPPYNHDLTEQFFRSLIAHVPNLTQSKIRYFPIPSFIPPTLWTTLIDTLCLALHSLPHLQKLQWDLGSSFPRPVLEAIAAHPSISDVTLNGLESWPITKDDSMYFSSLRVLRVSCNRTAGFGFVRAISRPQLLLTLDIALSVYLDNIPLAFFQPFSTLLHLSVNLTTLRLSVWPMSLCWAELQPLLNAHLLANLTISTRKPIIGLNDEALKELATALSSLEVLQLTSHMQDVSLIQITLLGLRPLIQLTPNLHTLYITITTRIADPGRIGTLLRFQPGAPHPLQYLDLGNSEINTDSDTLEFMGDRRTAGVLATLWPSLQSDCVCYGWENSFGPVSAMGLAWAGVKRYLQQRERDEKPISFL